MAGFFDLACFQGSSTWWHVSVLHLFLLPNNICHISFYPWIMPYFIHQLMDICVVFIVWLITCKAALKHTYFYINICLGVSGIEFLGHMVTV